VSSILTSPATLKEVKMKRLSVLLFVIASACGTLPSSRAEMYEAQINSLQSLVRKKDKELKKTKKYLHSIKLEMTNIKRETAQEASNKPKNEDEEVKICIVIDEGAGTEKKEECYTMIR
jgi:septal ring factor EnvC (AmiA/AmiB activator)